jgi:hypothetical protein
MMEGLELEIQRAGFPAAVNVLHEAHQGRESERDFGIVSLDQLTMQGTRPILV